MKKNNIPELKMQLCLEPAFFFFFVMEMELVCGGGGGHHQSRLSANKHLVDK